MAVYVPLLLLGLALALMTGSHLWSVRRERRKQVADQQRRVQLPVLVHAINDDRCTGCDACVVVCPTDVLDLVSNKSRVLRFGECIQCRQCMWSCPTQALVMHWETEDPPPLSVPNLDPYYQTEVPGMYLIGEVAGKPLVKNAANVGRAVVEHMRSGGMRPGGGARRRAEGSGTSSHRDVVVDVVIVGSGPGGLSAALTCIHHGYSYVVLEKEQVIASTIARYPKGKDIMAEPYEVRNVSFLPVFDSRKEELLPVWDRLREATGLDVKLGEAVEQIQRGQGGSFSVRTTVAAYRAQRVVLATGTRGKPRTLGVPGENLPKIASLLDDPDAYAGRETLVVGGGDSAVEAACALADAGARVLLSYRGPQLTRCASKNRDRVNDYIRRGKMKAHLGSVVVKFTERDVSLKVASGETVTLANDATFVLIGADAPVAWLEKLGVSYVERPHWYALGATDQLVESLLGRLSETPRVAEAAAALVLGGAAALPRSESLPPPPEASVVRPLPVRPTERPRTLPVTAEEYDDLFTSARHPSFANLAAAAPTTTAGPAFAASSSPLPSPEHPTADATDPRRPIPLSEFARDSRVLRDPGRKKRPRDAEATRILRTLRDEGARVAHEETEISMVEVGSADVSHSGIELAGSDVEVVSSVSGVEVHASPVPLIHDEPTKFGLQLDDPPKPPTRAVIVGLAGRRPTPARGRSAFIAAPTAITSPEQLAGLRRESLQSAPEERTVQVSIDGLEWDEEDERTVEGSLEDFDPRRR